MYKQVLGLRLSFTLQSLGTPFLKEINWLGYAFFIFYFFRIFNLNVSLKIAKHTLLATQVPARTNRPQGSKVPYLKGYPFSSQIILPAQFSPSNDLQFPPPGAPTRPQFQLFLLLNQQDRKRQPATEVQLWSRPHDRLSWNMTLGYNFD